MRGELGVDDRVIVVDDASTDGSAEAVERATHGDSRFLLIRNEKNLGVAKSRNLAVGMVRTEFVWFVDHDDFWESGTLSHYRAAIEDADVLISRADYRTRPDVPGRIVDGIDRAEDLDAAGALRLMLEGLVHGYLWSKLIRTSVLGVDPFPPLTSQSDFCGVAAMVSRASKVKTIPDVRYHYIKRTGSITRGRRVELGNFMVGRETMLNAAGRVGLDRDTNLLQFFTCWFFCHALVFVPLRQGSPREIFDEGMRLSRRTLRGIPLLPVFRRRPRVGAEMLLLRYGWFAYRPVMSMALRVVDARKREAERRSTGGK
nr:MULTISPECIES: glycosyltransferase family 2 protein [unclassified Microbacterium]